MAYWHICFVKDQHTSGISKRRLLLAQSGMRCSTSIQDVKIGTSISCFFCLTEMSFPSHDPRIISQRTLFKASRASLYLPCLYSFSPSETSWLAEYSSWRFPRSGITLVQNFTTDEATATSTAVFAVVVVDGDVLSRRSDGDSTRTPDFLKRERSRASSTNHEEKHF